jgi:hypothetical protein
MATLTAYNHEAQINLHQRPTIHLVTNGYELVGDRIKILQCELDNDTLNSGLNWCRVQFVQSGAIGWIRSDFIIFEDSGE